MIHENVSDKSEKHPPLRADKTIEWIFQSRSEWKQKCLDAKLKLKRQTLETKRARSGRQELKSSLKDARQKIEILTAELQEKEIQISELKKSHSPF